MAAVDALVSKVLDLLISTRDTEFKLGLKLLINPEVKSLTSNLHQIQDVLVDAERRQMKEAAVKLWLHSLKTVIHEIDDALDEWIYKMLKSQHRRKKVWSFGLLFPRFFFTTVPLCYRTAVKLKDLNKRLSANAIEKGNFFFLLSAHNDERVECPSRTATSVIRIFQAKGREADTARLVNMLVVASTELRQPRCIFVVGTGGIGKTTLAKLLYNDEIVKSHFDKRIWFCLSNTPNPVEMKSIAVKIQRSVEGKKFLLVLDDVWNEDGNEWMELEDFLRCGSSGSKILVTTRKQNVADLLSCGDQYIYRVGSLSMEDCWSLFSEIVFCEDNSEGMKNLATIGFDIVKRCEGLPLAVKTIAGLLRFKNSEREWESVLNSELWKLEEAKPSFSSLWLSYYDLTSSLKPCFLYCVIFPKGYRVSKDELISLWMAHGFLKPAENIDMEMVGRDYFDSLGMRYLFLDFEVEEKFNMLDKTYVRMHDMVHHIAKSKLLGTECLYLDVNKVQELENRALTAISRGSVYHLYVKVKEKLECPYSYTLYQLQKLRSLFFSLDKEGSLSPAALPKLFDELTSLRSLSLSRCRLESIPSNINKLIHLRWLKLSRNYALKELPETICELYNLQTLSVNWCDGLLHSPKGIGKLINLRNLKNDHTYFLLPKEIGKLRDLRKLSRVTVDPKFKDAFSLRDLKNLNNISGSLTIFFVERERGRLVKDARQAQLNEKKQITSLTLNFPERAAEEWMQQEDAELVEVLKPPLSLEMLRITCYAGQNCPSWINTLTSLRKLKLWYWSHCEQLPALAKLPCLELIEFNHFGRVKKVAAELIRMVDFVGPSSSTAPLFPKLKNLQFMNMNEWEEWSDYDGDEEVMPCLSYLSIENCPKLKTLPNFIREKANLHKQIVR